MADKDWLQPDSEGDDFRRYAAILRLHRWLILVCILLGAGAAIVYVKTATPVYTAETDLFISPVSTANTPAFASSGLITASSNPTGDIETAARVVASPAVAANVKAALHLRDSPQQILKRVSAQPVAESNIVSLTAQAGSPRRAADLANTFATTVIAQRTAQFHALLSTEIATLGVQLTGLPPAEAGVLQAQVAELKALLASPVPDMRISTVATPPTSRSSPRTVITVVGGVLGGLAVGVALALVLGLADVRVRRGEQIARLFRLPVLAVIPREGRPRGPLGRLVMRLPFLATLADRPTSHGGAPLTPGELSPRALEGYRTLRATLLAVSPHNETARSILITSASAGEGKTTCAINLASSFATSGAKVILVEAELHRPTIGKALGIAPLEDVGSVLTAKVPIESALVDSPLHGSNLRLLLARTPVEPNTVLGDALLLPTAARMVADAEQLADVVVIDAPPLAEVIDALEFARLVDNVLLVVRLNQTRVPRLRGLGEHPCADQHHPDRDRPRRV